MELPDIGKNCSIAECNTLDFLPIICECGKTFCNDHFMEHALYCGKPDNFVTSTSKNLSVIYKCSFDKCAVGNLHNFPCIICGNHFCIAHRYHKQCEVSEEQLLNEKIKWNIPLEQFKESKKTIDQQVTANIEKAKLNPKKSKTANKLQLMRLKGKAKGQETIPVIDRVYCLVYLPCDSNPKTVTSETDVNVNKEVNEIIVKTQAIYISKQWTLGKVVDSISSICGIVNNNSKPDANKLRLFKYSTGAIVHHIMGTTLDELFKQEIVCDGESVILEYINAEDSNLGNVFLEKFNLYC